MQVNLNSKEFIEHLVGLPVSSYEVSEGCKEGDNVAGTLTSIKITRKKGQDAGNVKDASTSGNKISVVLKVIPENPPEWIIKCKIFRIEHGFYRTLAPLLKTFAGSRGLPYEPPIPRYFSGFNDDQRDYLCIEDLRPQGFIMPDKRVSLRREEIVLILQELAKLHAVSYAFMQTPEGPAALDGDENLKYIKKYDPSEQGDYMWLIKTYFAGAMNVLRKKGREDLAERMAKIEKDVEEIRERHESNDKYFETLIHSDLWVNNLLIKYDDKDCPVEVEFIDFQIMQRGSVFRELSYFFFTSTTAEFRKAHLVDCLGEYFERFEESLYKLKCPLPQGFTREFLITEFTGECFLPGFVQMTFAIPVQLGTYFPPAGEEGKGPTGGEDFVENISNYYLSNPLPLQRLEDLAQEVIEKGQL